MHAVGSRALHPRQHQAQAAAARARNQLLLADEVMSLWGETEARTAASASGLGALPPPYWAFAWPGGQALARYIIDNPRRRARPHRARFRCRLGPRRHRGCQSGRILRRRRGDRSARARGDRPELAGERRFRRTHRQSTSSARTPAGTPSSPATCATSAPSRNDWSPGCVSSSRNGVRVLLGDPGRNYFPGRRRPHARVLCGSDHARS